MSSRRARRLVAVLAGLLATATLVTATGPSDAAPRRLPDLAVSTVSGSAKAEVGQRLTATARVVNRGKVGSRRSTLRFALSRDARPGSDLTLTPLLLLDGLRTGRGLTVRERLTVPDSTKPGRYRLIACTIPSGPDAARGNNCRVGGVVTVVEAPWEGRLSGTLTFSRSSDRVEPGDEEHSSDQLQIGFDIDVDERLDGWDGFEPVQSGYTYNGSRTHVRTDPDCRTTVEATAQGAGPIKRTGHPYYDVFYGDFAKLDHSELRLITQLPYSTTTTTSVTQLGEYPCGSGSSATTTARTIDSLRLRQIRRSPDEVVYRVVQAEHGESQPTTWQHITGTLIFTRAG